MLLKLAYFLKFNMENIILVAFEWVDFFSLWQLVDKLDQGDVPAELGPLDYKGLYKAIKNISFTIAKFVLI